MQSSRDNNFYFVSLDVSTVSPNTGSRMGGQTITIAGGFFTNTIAHIKVTVEGTVLTISLLLFLH